MSKLSITKISAIAFIVILVLFHFLNTSVNPNWQPISEYALGKGGFLMNCAFILLGISFLFLGISLLQKVPNIGTKVGAILLLISAAGTLTAGIFNTDPITTLPENISISGKIHSTAAGLLGFMILSTIFITVQFYKQNIWRPYKKSMLTLTAILWISELSLIGFMGYFLGGTNAMISADTPIGWPGRIVIILCAIWCYVCANYIHKSEIPTQQRF